MVARHALLNYLGMGLVSLGILAGFNGTGNFYLSAKMPPVDLSSFPMFPGIPLSEPPQLPSLLPIIVTYINPVTNIVLQASFSGSPTSGFFHDSYNGSFTIPDGAEPGHHMCTCKRMFSVWAL